MPAPTSHRHSRPARRNAPAFTLVELLVVIGIISVLIAVLMPALSSARRQARAVTCMSNLRQFGVAFQMYCNENKGRCYRYVDNSGEHLWIPLLQPHIGNVDAVRLCPEAPRVGTLPFGNVVNAWGDPSGSESVAPWLGRGGSYGMNMWLHPLPQDGLDGLAVYGHSQIIGPRSAYISFPAKDSPRVPLFGDCNWVGGWPRHTDPPPPNLAGTYELDNHLRRFCMARHKRSVNMVFLDGHAEGVALEDLWRLKWNNEFEPTRVTLPRE